MPQQGSDVKAVQEASCALLRHREILFCADGVDRFTSQHHALQCLGGRDRRRINHVTVLFSIDRLNKAREDRSESFNIFCGECAEHAALHRLNLLPGRVQRFLPCISYVQLKHILVPQVQGPFYKALLLHGFQHDHHCLRRDEACTGERRGGDTRLRAQLRQRDVLCQCQTNRLKRRALFARSSACSACLRSLPRR